MTSARHRVCPVERSGRLDGRLRAWVQNPEKILSPYVKEGMRALDVGCGPGFFTLPMARLVGGSGRVVACDLQTGMLEKVAGKIENSPLRERIILHPCTETALGLTGLFDFAVAFYVVHELPDQQAFFDELAGLMAPGGRFLMVEPPMHVSRKAFTASLAAAARSGLTVTGRPRFFLGMGAVLEPHHQGARATRTVSR
ncbi:class I SAM-dependent methyltransferase [Desulfatiferula olefinivorans]